MDAGVYQCLGQGLVGLAQIDVFANHRDAHVLHGALEARHHGIPLAEIDFGGVVELKLFHHHVVQTLLMVDPRHHVNALGIERRQDCAFRNIGEQRNFSPFGLRQGHRGTAEQHIGLDADGAQLLDRMLGGLGFDLTGRCNVGHQGQVNEHRTVFTELDAHLSDRFQKWQRFNVAYRAANLDEGDIGIACALTNARLDVIGDMRNHLYGATEVLASALLADHVLVDLAGGEVVVLAHRDPHEPLVVAEIEIRLRTVTGDVHLSVLKRVHRARIDVDVRIELDERHVDAAGFQNRGQRGGSYPLPQRGNYTARDEDESRHLQPDRWRKIPPPDGRTR